MKSYLALLFLLPSLVSSAFDEQVAIPGFDMAQDAEPAAPTLHTQPTLSDLLTIEPAASIFFSYARDTEISRLFSEVDARSTLLVPTNKAVMALARKPYVRHPCSQTPTLTSARVQSHQDPEPIDSGIEISEQEFDARSKKNVERWVSMHIIPQSPISLSSGPYQTLNEKKTVSFEIADDDTSKPEWERALLNGDVRILQMKKACNGVFYLIDGTVRED
ncbi:hypothetical protein EWM64_g674 [Hericium alpestre]|uniref:FAS1 domain-containing protein n=1 Tax=Hericium alpestre TaxID=135208 RepID=A0A4Z0AAJ1_9AGAM|nr:hypothetical protein EWM64_g674 [Hericium alpestre]